MQHREVIMVIASRTPEGTPNRCPVCGNDLKMDPSKPTLDAPCPHCGHLLWFAPDRPPAREQLAKVVLRLGSARFGPPNETTRSAVESIAESERLEALFLRMLTCTSWEDVLEAP